MIRALLSRLKGELALSLIRTFVARGIAAVGGVLLFVVLGRLYGAEGVGVFALAQSIYLGAGILARYGMDNALMRYVGQDPTSSAVPVYLRWALTKSALLSTTAAVLVYFLCDSFALWFDAPLLASVLPLVALTIPPVTAAYVLAGFMKGIRKPATACLLENGSIALIAGLFLMALELIRPGQFENTLIAIAISSWFITTQGLFQAWRLAKRNASKESSCPKVEFEGFNKSCFNYFISSLAGFSQNILSVFVLGQFLTSHDLGLYKVSERIAVLVRFVVTVVNSVLPPRFAEAYNKNDIKQLASLVQAGAISGVVVAAPFFVFCLFFPAFVLKVFGDGFEGAKAILQILVLGQSFFVLTGSVNYLLNMTGNDLLMRNISLITSFLALLCLSVMSHFYALVGSALAMSLMYCLQNGVALVYVRKQINMWALPFICKL
jgi:O-antigen/teichoic acid export membrane protein